MAVSSGPDLGLQALCRSPSHDPPAVVSWPGRGCLIFKEEPECFPEWLQGFSSL